MALKSTIFKATIQLSDLNRHYYDAVTLTIARHPSETDERMMVRVLAHLTIASEGVEFGRGLSSEDEADVWQKDLSGDILHWIDVGRPSIDRIRKACGKSQQVSVIAFGGHAANIWFNDIESAIQRFTNLTIYTVNKNETDGLALLADRNMQLSCTIDGHSYYFNNDQQSIEISLLKRHPA